MLLFNVIYASHSSVQECQYPEHVEILYTDFIQYRRSASWTSHRLFAPHFSRTIITFSVHDHVEFSYVVVQREPKSMQGFTRLNTNLHRRCTLDTVNTLDTVDTLDSVDTLDTVFNQLSNILLNTSGY